MKFIDLAKETATATGSMPLVLGGAVTRFRVFAPVNGVGYNVGEVVPYRATQGDLSEIGYGTKTANSIERTTVTASTNGGAPVNFVAGPIEVHCNVPAAFLNGVEAKDLAPAGALSGADIIPIVQNGIEVRTTLTAIAAAVAAINGGAPADTAVPTMTGSLASSNVTQNGFTLTWPAASDNVAAIGYETSTDGGTTYSDAGNVLSRAFVGLTAGTAHQTRVRAYDAAGNRSVPLSLQVTTAASADVTAPTMAGSLTTSSVAQTGYTMNWPAASDNVAVTGYETSTDGGTTYSDAGNVTSRAIAGATAGTTYPLRVRAYDAAGNRSAPLSASVTTAAAAGGTAYTITGYGTPANTIAATVDVSARTAIYNAKRQIAMQYLGTNAAYPQYVTISPVPPSLTVGWGTSPTVPPAVITAVQNGGTGGGSQNGLVPHPVSATLDLNVINLWAEQGSGDGIAPSGDGTKWYLWFKPSDGAASCFNPSGLVLTGA